MFVAQMCHNCSIRETQLVADNLHTLMVISESISKLCRIDKACKNIGLIILRVYKATVHLSTHKKCICDWKVWNLYFIRGTQRNQWRIQRLYVSSYRITLPYVAELCDMTASVRMVSNQGTPIQNSDRIIIRGQLSTFALVLIHPYIHLWQYFSVVLFIIGTWNVVLNDMLLCFR